ncbi:MAG: amidohydrolase family protein [Luteitalea sp.]|nr:amidohydrolase family protein [Luteitalea sp.]
MLRSLFAILLAIAGIAWVQEVPAPTVDHHQHLFSPATRVLSPTVKPVNADDLIGFLDEAGIRRAVVLSIAYQYGNPNRPAVEDEYAKVKAENDWTSVQVARHPDRLRGLCGVNPLKPYAVAEIKRCSADPSLRFGITLHFGNSDVNLLDARHRRQLETVFRTANQHRMAIVVHMRSTVSLKRPYGKAQAAAFLELFEAAPDMPVQVGHLAGAGGYDDPQVDEALEVFVDAIAAADVRTKNLFFDVSGVAGLGDWMGKAHEIAARLRQLGLERLLYGSDGTADLLRPRDAWAAFSKLPLSAEEFRVIATNVAPYMR